MRGGFGEQGVSFARVVPTKGWWALGVAFRARKLGDKTRPEAERAVLRGTQGRKASVPSGTRPPGWWGLQMAALRLRVNPDTWCDRSPSWHSLLPVPVAALQGPVTGPGEVGRGARGLGTPYSLSQETTLEEGGAYVSSGCLLGSGHIHLASILAPGVDGAI